ncbi:MAG TPA: hypothetical protein VGF17_22615 [Phytomonospora sp.]
MPLNRLTAYAGHACAILLLFNVVRRAGVLPDNALTHAVAPFAVLTGLFAITGLYRLIRPAAGALGLVGYVLNAAGVAWMAHRAWTAPDTAPQPV